MHYVGSQDYSQERLLWVDCEFTGLDLDQGHKIIEIGAIVTDFALKELDSYQAFVHYDWTYIEEHMDKNPWWTDRLTDRERMKEGNLRAIKPAIADTALASIVSEYFPTSRPPLCGNSISNDKKHIEAQFPGFSEKLSYQIIDVSSFKLVAKMYRGIEYEDKIHRHYAIDDINESIEEFRFLLNRLGITSISDVIEP